MRVAPHGAPLATTRGEPRKSAELGPGAGGACGDLVHAQAHAGTAGVRSAGRTRGDHTWECSAHATARTGPMTRTARRARGARNKRTRSMTQRSTLEGAQLQMRCSSLASGLRSKQRPGWRSSGAQAAPELRQSGARPSRIRAVPPALGEQIKQHTGKLRPDFNSMRVRQGTDHLRSSEFRSRMRLQAILKPQGPATRRGGQLSPRPRTQVIFLTTCRAPCLMHRAATSGECLTYG